MKQHSLIPLLCAVAAATSVPALAQTRAVSGRITGADGAGLPGVTVLERGTTNGTSTSADGNFSLTVQPGATLVLSSIGYTTVERAIGNNAVINVTLATDTKLIGEVVVTALGLEANKDQLGTAQATVKGQALVQSGETSVITGLSGKTPGVVITRSSGDPGASANIQIRGASTITGNLQPLIVVDGVPISNTSIGNDGIAASSGGAQSNQTDGVVQASRLNDINPEDIASMEVIRGAAASAVWGTRAANGVIVIVTKKGRNKNGGINLSYRTSYGIDEINRRVPLQNKFGQGGQGSYNNTNVRSWGDRIADRPGGPDTFITGFGQFFRRNPDGTFTDLYQGFNTFADGTVRYNIPSAGDFLPDKTTRLSGNAGKNSRETFDHSDDAFQRGYTWDNVATMSGSTERSNFYASLGNTYTRGIARAGSDNDRTTIRLNATHNFTDKFRAVANTTYARTRSNRVQQGSNISGIFLGGLRTPADFNNEYFVGTYTDPAGNLFPNRQSSYRNQLGRTTGPGFDNPLWTINNVKNQTRVNRFLGSLELSYDVLPWLNVLNRTGVDTYTDNRNEYFPIGSAAIPVGSLRVETIQETQVNNDLIVRATKQVNEDISLSGLVGYNLNGRRATQIGATATQFVNPLSPPQLGNTPSENRTPFNLLVIQNTAALYGQVDIGLFDQLFLNATLRGEQASTFGPEAKSTFIYPGASAAWQFTKLGPLADNKLLSFGKVRLSYGQVGVQPTPYLTQTYYANADASVIADGWGTVLDAAAYGGGSVRLATQGNPLLKPERKTESEVGLDLRFVQDRLGFSATAYANETRDAILSIPRAATTGFTSINSNAATIRNRGIELSFDGDVIRKDKFSVNIAPNFSLNRNKVTNLAGAESVFLNGFTGSDSRAVLNQQLGMLFGNRWARNESGGFVVDAQGFPTLGTPGVIGDPNPQWRGGLNVNARYKALSLSVLFDHTRNADVWNGTKGALYSYGTHDDTGEETTVSAAEAASLPVYQISGATNATAFQRATTVAERYRPNGDGTYTFRGRLGNYGGGIIALDEGWYQAGLGNGFNGPSEQFVENVNWTRLREVTLNYSLTQSWVKNYTRLSAIDLTVTGRNLVLWTPYSGIDPETNLTGVSNGRGLDYFNNPSTRSLIFSLKLTY